ncbi:DUF1302 domain-containing protein [Lysobacter fragariae]
MAIAVAAALGSVTAPAHAVEIETSNPDLKISFDNTVRYTLGVRVEGQDDTIMAQPNANDGDGNFDKGSIVTNRIDLLSEFDIVYKDYYGFRASGQAWRDFAYDNLDTKSTSTYNHIGANGQQQLGLANFADRYFHRTSGEILDAFFFARIPFGDRPMDVKLGRHSEYWGESLFPAGTYDSIAYSQQPLDLGRAAAMPGVEAKELYRPLTHASFTWQVSPTLSLMGQYYTEWKPFFFPEGGTYLGNGDPYLNSVQTSLLIPNPLAAYGIGGPLSALPHGEDSRPKNSGEYGVAARWTPEWADGTFGVYYREFADKLPQLYISMVPKTFTIQYPVQLPDGSVMYVPVPVTATLPDKYHFAYADDIKLYGLSYGTTIGGVSIGAELSYRKNMPLNSDPVLVLTNQPVDMVLPPGLVPELPDGARMITGATLERGESPGARGNTWHGVFNAVDVLAGNALWDQLTLVGELNIDRWAKVTQGMQWFQGRPGRTGIDKVSKTAVGMTVLASPTWYEVFPGVALSAPVSVTYGLSGNSPIFLGSAKGGGTYSYGVSADILQKYTLSLQYVDFFGRGEVSPIGALTAAGTNTTLKDRGFVALTFKTKF